MPILTLHERINLLINSVALAFFSYIAYSQANGEFTLYIFVIVFFMTLIAIAKFKNISFPSFILYFLTIWSVLHMAGGLLPYGESVWYNIILIPISVEYQILKYDQALHAFGFFVATLVCYLLLLPHLKNTKYFGFPLMFVLVAAGCGLGAINEVVEFMATVTMTETNVGGYLNTSLDLVANLVGAVVAVIFLRFYIRNKS